MSVFDRYIGKPFGEGPGEVTCWTLVTSILRDEFDIDLPSYGEISARDLVRVARAMGSGADEPQWVQVETPAAYDVALMRVRGGKTIQHVGICTSSTHLLHVEARTNVVRVPLDHFSIRGRLVGFRRHLEIV